MIEALVPAESPPCVERQDSLRALARDFVLIDCSVWISMIVSSAQRHDSQAISANCQGMLDTLSLLHAEEALETVQRLEGSCPFLNRAEMLALSCQLLRETTRLVHRLRVQLSDPAWGIQAESEFSREEIPTSKRLGFLSEPPNRRSAVDSNVGPCAVRAWNSDSHRRYPPLGPGVLLDRIRQSMV